jgi:hypothetical protein
MKKLENGRFLLVWSWSLGIIDSLTGLGLICLPELTLRLMGLDSSAYTLALIRFIGAFVFSNGSLYLWGIFFFHRSGLVETLSFTWLATAWARVCVSIVTGILLANDMLAVGWASVSAFDGAVAIFQIYWISSKRLIRNENRSSTC